MFLEIYYDPQFYVLELLIENKDSHAFSNRQPVDLSLYKGQKKIRADFEEGDYVLKIVAKHATGQQSEAHFNVKYYQYQLYMVVSDQIKALDQFPETLNMLGMLGPTGKGYGQFIYLIPDIDFGPGQRLELMYEHKGTIDAQVVDERGHGNLLSVAIVDDVKQESNKKNAIKKNLGVTFIDEEEDFVSFESINAKSDGNK